MSAVHTATFAASIQDSVTAVRMLGDERVTGTVIVSL